MVRRSNRMREEDEYDEYEGGRVTRPRREYDEREREFLSRPRRRDEGNFGLAYGGGYGGGRRFRDEDEDVRDDGGFENRRARMGWGSWEEEGEAERRRGGVGERLGYWSRSRPGEYGGEERYRRGREEEERFGGRRRYGAVGVSGGGGRFEEDEFERGRVGRGRDWDEERRYVGGRHVGGNIGQGQMDYGEEGYRRGGRGGSRWEDEDVDTVGRGQRGRGQSSLFEEEERRGRTRNTGVGRRVTAGRGRKKTARRTTNTGRTRTTKTKTRKTNKSRTGTTDENTGT